MTRRAMRLGEVASRLGDRRVEGDPGFTVSGVAALDEGGPEDLGFLRAAANARHLAGSRIGALIAPDGVDVGERPVIRSPAPNLDFARAAGWIAAAEPPAPGVHPSAVVDASAKVDPGATIGARVVVGARVAIGAGSIVHANVTLYDDVSVGRDCVVHAGVVVREDCRLGDRVVLQPGAVIGGDGFGFEFDEQGRLEKIPQVGNVVIEDDVEIGAGSTIDRARLGTTRIGCGVKIDNLVQVGHGCDVGDGSALVAQSGLAGSTRLGRRVFLMAQSGVGGQAKVGDGSFLGARAGLTTDVEPGSRIWGFPGLPERTWHRATAVFARLPELVRRVRALEKKAGIERPPRPRR